MALEPTVFLVHLKIISGATPPEGSIAMPDFLMQLAAKANGAQVDRVADHLKCVWNLSKKLEEIKKDIDCHLSWPPRPSTPSNTGWVDSPYTVVSRATDNWTGETPQYRYTYQFDNGVVEVEYCVSLGFAGGGG